MYNNLYQYPVRDKNENNGLETQFLVDTGANYSLLNYDSYLEHAKIQKKLHLLKHNPKHLLSMDKNSNSKDIQILTLVLTVKLMIL